MAAIKTPMPVATLSEPLLLIEANERQKSLECRENSVEPPIILKLVDEERIVRLVWDWTPSDLLPTW
jgi:hypothetical protein